ncbi:MAG: glycosyltransferase [Sphingomonadales bacterium]|nr:glycosyltransferase [Sphingomonadales bacterium]
MRFLVGHRAGALAATIPEGVAVTELSPPVRRSLFSRFRLGRAMAREIARLDPDVVFLPGNFHLQLCIPIGAERRRLGAGWTVAFKLSNPITPNRFTAPLLRRVVRHYHDCIDAVAAMNGGIARELAALVPEADIRTLHDPTYLNPGMSHAHVPDADGRFHIVWAGRFEPQKDVMLALRTMRALATNPPGGLPPRLSLLGSGSQRRAVERAIRRLGLTDIVDTPGHVPQIDPWLERADVLLVTSHFEGGPAVAVEALAHGVPVVSTDCSHFLRDILPVGGGRIIGSRAPAALADALRAVAAAPPPDADALARLIDHLAPETCAAAYLDWFDSLAPRR